MKINKYILVLLNTLVVSPVFAADDPPQISGIFDILDKVMALIFPVAGLICFAFIVMGGYMWIISGGDPGRVKQAQGTLTWAIIGLVLVLLVRLIVSLVINFVVNGTIV